MYFELEFLVILRYTTDLEFVVDNELIFYRVNFDTMN